jgi:hypothetical protein
MYSSHDIENRSAPGDGMQGVGIMTMAVLGIRFLVELAGIGALAYWGWQTGPDGIGRILLAAGAALGLIVVWGVVVAPRADNRLSQPQRDIIGTVLLLLAAGALGVAGQPTVALVFGTVVVIDWLAMVVLGPAAVDAVRPTAAVGR